MEEIDDPDREERLKEEKSIEYRTKIENQEDSEGTNGAEIIELILSGLVFLCSL
ncbi:hypothetical protein [Psychrobacillus sp. OK032]|uniref:hypothetical protein n=1 Tax=Psychrobacillus sp. OK032 TaxID=1884358 RepID=UPI0015A6E76E|nr:hypothetical protein [Psychrobacillus sp. OK032]